jgi:hypothetical protein
MIAYAQCTRLKPLEATAADKSDVDGVCDETRIRQVRGQTTNTTIFRTTMTPSAASTSSTCGWGPRDSYGGSRNEKVRNGTGSSYIKARRLELRPRRGQRCLSESKSSICMSIGTRADGTGLALLNSPASSRCELLAIVNISRSANIFSTASAPLRPRPPPPHLPRFVPDNSSRVQKMPAVGGGVRPTPRKARGVA